MRVPKKHIFLFILTANVVAMTAALLCGETPDQCFKESGFLTYFSFAQLLIACFLAFSVFRQRKTELKRPVLAGPAFIWLLMSVGFAFLAVDEVFEIHENIDGLIHHLFGFTETGLTDRIDDAVIGLYLAVGAVFCLMYRSELLGRRVMIRFFLAGGVLTFLMIFFDALTNREDLLALIVSSRETADRLWPWAKPIEDIFKQLAEVMFIGGLLFADEEK